MKMDPTAFRAQLLQNFRVRLCPGELGAIFTTFDKDKSMLIDGTEVRAHYHRVGSLREPIGWHCSLALARADARPQWSYSVSS